MSLSAGETELLDALRRYIVRIEWFSIWRAPEEGLETGKMRLLLAQWEEEVVPACAGTAQCPYSIGTAQSGSCDRHHVTRVRLMFFRTLHELVETRFHWLILQKA